MAIQASRLNVRDEGEITRIQFLERNILEETSIQQIGDELCQIVDLSPTPKLLIMFENVEHLSSAALGMLIRVNNKIRQKGGQLRLSDIDPQISAMDHIRLCDIHTIQQSLGENSDESGDAMAAAAAITEDGLDRFNRWFDSLDVAPQIQEMQKRSEQIRKQELNKSLRGLTGVTDEQIAVIDTLTRSIVKKMLHKPITDLKRSAGSYRLHDIRSISSTE